MLAFVLTYAPKWPQRLHFSNMMIKFYIFFQTILTQQTNFYSKLATECVAAGCSVDMFLFPNSYCDVATISDICRLTSGNMYKYSYFQVRAFRTGWKDIMDFMGEVGAAKLV